MLVREKITQVKINTYIYYVQVYANIVEGHVIWLACVFVGTDSYKSSILFLNPCCEG